jgi:glycosyltransferase involved in cell wall biosynthesis
VENEETMSYASQFCFNIISVIGPIECNRYKPFTERQISNTVTIGWIGSPSTTKYLLLIKDVFILLKKKFGENICFTTIGADEKQLEGLPIVNYNWNIKTEVELLRKFDIGIMPLPNDEWARGKGGYKLLQYMSMGIPSVASPVGANCKILIDGKTGYFAANVHEWIDMLILLISNKLLRDNIGKAARRYSIQNYSFESSVDRLYPVLKRL